MKFIEHKNKPREKQDAPDYVDKKTEMTKSRSCTLTMYF